MSRKLKVLVADDTEPNLLLISKFINKLGHHTVLARNGFEAIQQFQAEAPDLVLMDIMMPGMNGYEATAKIREISAGKWIPIIFLTAKSQDQDHVKGIQVGGDDYLSKPVNLVILEARIKAVTRIADMQLKIIENTEQLAHYRDENEQELQLAKHLIEKITRHDHFAHKSIHRWLKPAKHLSGDIFVSAFSPADEIHLLLADGTGHGLSAALNVIPVVDVFHGMTTKGFAISSIAYELNRKIKQLMPTERFVAATLVSINLSERVLHIWNGGNPPALFVDENGNIQRTFKSNHPALGIFGEAEFDSSAEVFHWDEPGQLVMCSDGLLEVQNVDGQEFGLSRLEQILTSTPMEGRFGHLVNTIEAYMEGLSAHDDISLGAITCPVEDSNGPQRQEIIEERPSLSPQAQPGRWGLSLRLTAAELKEIDVVPLLLTWMDQLRLDRSHHSQVFLIFSELFNNALDHGILTLDSRLKYQPDGFERYVEERRQRLANLQQGLLGIEIERMRQQNHEILRIHIKDSGKGFDYKRFIDSEISSGTRPAGRGLALVKNLCSKIEYAGNGNEVTVFFILA